MLKVIEMFVMLKPTHFSCKLFDLINMNNIVSLPIHEIIVSLDLKE